MDLKKFLKISTLSSILLLSDVSLNAACTSTWTSVIDQNWGTAANWTPNCVPGGVSSGDTDNATFSNLSGQFTVNTGTVGHPVGLQFLTFDNAVNSYTIAGVDAIDINGVNPIINVINGNHFINLAAAVEPDGNNVSIILNNASSILHITCPISEGAPGASLNITGNGTFFHSNVNLNGADTNITGDITVSGGSYINENTLPVLFGAIGNTANFAGLTMNSPQTFSNRNTGNVTGAGSIGVLLNPTGAVNVNDGTFENFNTGGAVIDTNAIGCDMRLNAFNIQGKAQNLNDTGTSVTNTSIGTRIQTTSSIQISNPGKLINNNNGNVNTNSLGVDIQVNSDMTSHGGTFQNSNSGTVTTNSTGARTTVSGNFLTNLNGSVLNQNSGSVTGATTSGSLLTVSGILTVNNSQFQNSNTGSATISTNAVGADVQTPQFNLQNGTLKNTSDTGVTVTGTSIGSRIQSPNIQITGASTLINQNGASVNGTSVGCTIPIPSSLNLNNSNIKNMNSGSIQGASVGADLPITGSISLINNSVGANNNSGSVKDSGSFGARMHLTSFADFTLSQFTTANSGKITLSGQGSSFRTGSDLSVINSSLNNTNSGEIINGSSLGADTFILGVLSATNNSAIVNSNSASVTGGIGSRLQNTSTVNISGSSLSNENNLII